MYLSQFKILLSSFVQLNPKVLELHVGYSKKRKKNYGLSSGLNLHCVLLNSNFDYLVHELVGYDLLVVS